ncbi:serine-threonine protein kinase, PKA suppressor [Scheffersomyces coipomensis]|uniref:serine-threonine protein kinase, PKA suppressor n=1 Tax=Scheffersomyces coipomensis TaxID=1788519 RepID=UPI00315D8E0D
MAYNYNYNRHNSIGGNWHLPPPQGFSGSTSNTNTHDQQNQEFLQQKQQQMQGFRNPWYNHNQQSPGGSNTASISQSPTKGIPLLQQQQASKRMSFANNLPTTYEYDDQRHNAPPYIHPPTRADNPFNQYFTNQEVSLGNDRRMSAAAAPTVNNGYYNSFVPQGGDNYQAQYLQNSPNLNRRSSVGVSNYQQMPHYAIPPGRVKRSPSIVEYQQYQRAVQSQRVSIKRRPAPKAMKVYSKFDLRPKVHQQPKYRRCSVNSIHISPVNALSVYLTESYTICQPRKFQYSKSTNPRRVLTKPSEPKFNNGYDNEDSDYILFVNDILGTEEGRKYIVLDLLGSGTFGQVVKCQNLTNQSVCAVKVIKSKPAYMNQSLTEVRLLEFLNANSDGKNFIRLLDTFMHKEHLCLVFELLASNLYELIKQNQFQGLNMKLVKLLTRQLLEAMAQLKGFQMIHCDLKPENILLCQPDKPDIKVIDFGSACFTRQTIYTYIQSRFYRSPEVILGLPYTESIDMWSLGCIVGELFLGLPMFPGTSEYNQIWKIVDMLGLPPKHMIEVGRNSMNFFKKVPPVEADGKTTYVTKTFDEYVEFLESSKSKDDTKKKEQANKNYFKQRLLKDIVLNYKLPSKKMTNSMIEKECQERLLLIDFLTKVLNLNPLERLTPQEGLKHPFVNDVRTDAMGSGGIPTNDGSKQV